MAEETHASRVKQFREALLAKLAMDDQHGRSNFFAGLTLTPPVLFLIVMAGFPTAYTIYLSVTDASLFSPSASFVGLDNYTHLYTMQEFFDAVWRGVIFSLGSVAFQIVTGLSLALALNKKFFGSSFARTFAIFPYLVPTIAVALMWQWMLSPLYGVVNSYGVKFGLIEESISFFGEPGLAMPMLVVANSWKFISFAFLIFLARLQAIDENMYEQAKVSGASTIQMFRTITLPSLRSAILLVVLLRSIWMFNKFDIVWLLTKGGPLEATTTLPVFIYRLTFNRYELATGAAAAINLFMILAVFAAIYFWYFQPSKEVSA